MTYIPKHLQSDSSRAVTLIMKIQGNKCNLKCTYCYNSLESHIPTEIASASADDTIAFLSNYKDWDHVLIVFHGGEPLLTPIADIRHILDYVYCNFTGSFNIQFQTNGLLIDRSWLDLWSRYGDRISISVSLEPEGLLDLRYGKNKDYRTRVEHNLRESALVIKNVGVIAIAHKLNTAYFRPFIDQLIQWHIPGLTINKVKFLKGVNAARFKISESEYVDLLLDILNYWISSKKYRAINILPLSAFFQKSGNKLCSFLPDVNKCSLFHTFYNAGLKSNVCNHMPFGALPRLDPRCKECDLFSFCGGGCLAETKEPDFCHARRHLAEELSRLKRVSNGNSKALLQ